MKKNAYISPSVEITAIAICTHILEGSPTGTNIDDLGVSDTDAPEDMIGRGRRNDVWMDEEEEEEF
jgi:hypothetical protein